MSENDTIVGTVWRFGTDVDTDIILPWEYAHLEPAEYAQHIMEPVDEDFADKLDPGDVIVAETNFGIGSSREHAPIALKESGVGAVIAASFGRIFYRNAINQGLPVIECDMTDIECIDEGDALRIDLFDGHIVNETKDETYEFEEFTEPVRSILEAGGARAYYADH